MYVLENIDLFEVVKVVEELTTNNQIFKLYEHTGSRNYAHPATLIGPLQELFCQQSCRFVAVLRILAFLFLLPILSLRLTEKQYPELTGIPILREHVHGKYLGLLF